MAPGRLARRRRVRSINWPIDRRFAAGRLFMNGICVNDVGDVIKAIGNNEERKRNHSTETQDFNAENPLQ
jgi:hypothetical protein